MPPFRTLQLAALVHPDGRGAALCRLGDDALEEVASGGVVRRVLRGCAPLPACGPVHAGDAALVEPVRQGLGGVHARHRVVEVMVARMLIGGPPRDNLHTSCAIFIFTILVVHHTTLPPDHA